MARRPSSLTTRGQACLSGGVVLLLSGLVLGLSDLTRVGVLLVTVVGVAFALGRRHPLRLDVDRQVHPVRVVVEEPATVTVTVRNPDRARSTLEIMAEEQLDYGLGDRPRFILPPLSPGEAREAAYVIRSAHRGVHSLGPLAARARDPFGMTLRLAPVGGVGRVVVVPRVHPLVGAPPAAGGASVDGSLRRSLALQGQDDQSIREYREGDDLRRIHWPATARTGQVMVRQEDRPTVERAVVLLDSRGSAHRGTGRSSTLEWSVAMAASVVSHLLDSRYAVRLVTADGQADVGCREDADLPSALDTLAALSLGPDTDWAHVVHAAGNTAAPGSLVVVCAGALDEDAARAVAPLRRHGAAGLALLVDPAASGPTPNPAGPGPAVLRAAGWVVLAAPPSSPPSRAWAAATTRGVLVAP